MDLGLADGSVVTTADGSELERQIVSGLARGGARAPIGITGALSATSATSAAATARSVGAPLLHTAPAEVAAQVPSGAVGGGRVG